MELALFGMGHRFGPHEWDGFNGHSVGNNGLWSLLCFPLSSSLLVPAQLM